MAEERMLKRATSYSVILMLFIVLFSAYFQDKQSNLSFASEISKTPAAEEQNPTPAIETVNTENLKFNIWEQVAGKEYEKIKEQVGEKCIIIRKPANLGSTAAIELEDLAVDRSIELTIYGLTEQNLRDTDIGRIYKEEYSDGIPPSPTPTPMIKEFDSTDDKKEDLADTTVELNQKSEKLKDTDEEYQDPVRSVTYTYSEADEKGCYTVSIMILLDTTYAYKVIEDDNNYYIALLRPKDVYSRIVVLDAGHGGLDSGTYSRGDEDLEKDMNLSMLLYLKEYLEQEEIKIYCTRTTDRRLTLSQRVELANAVEADFFLSIHCNANTSSSIHGIEVLYNDKQNNWEQMNSKQFSKICLEEVNSLIGLESRGIVPRSHNVTIIGEAEVPVALVEVAFMSNRSDLAFLRQEENRKLAAEGMYNAIMRGYKELEQENLVLVQEQKTGSSTN